MLTMNERKKEKYPLFKMEGGDIFYKLFDAFIEAVLGKDGIIDFSKEPIEKSDGSLEFNLQSGKFSELLEENKEYKDIEEEADPIKKARRALFFVHLNWLFTLGAGDLAHTCGEEYMKILGMQESPKVCCNMDKENPACHLWNMGQVKVWKSQNFPFLTKLFEQIFTWKTGKPASLKDAILQKCLKMRDPAGLASARHCLMHLSSPNDYMHFVSHEHKIAFLERRHWNIPTKKNDLYYCQDKYVAGETDRAVRECFEDLCSKHGDMEYIEFMKQFVWNSIDHI